MEQLHAHDRDSDIEGVSASTASHIPRQRTPRIEITAEELHR